MNLFYPNKVTISCYFIMSYTLKIKILDSCPDKEYVKNYYQNIKNIGYVNDCGIDLIFPSDFYFATNQVTKCGLGIACELISNNDYKSKAFVLDARSSISNTPLMLANSRGIIDPGYRGEIIAAFRCFIDKNHKSTINDFCYIAKKGDRLVQIVAPDMEPIKVVLTDDLSQTDRNTNAFGSTNIL